MSPASTALQRILKSVFADLERDCYAPEAIAAAMTVLGLQRLFSEEKQEALRMLDSARRLVAGQGDEEWLQ